MSRRNKAANPANDFQRRLKGEGEGEEPAMIFGKQLEGVYRKEEGPQSRRNAVRI